MSLLTIQASQWNFDFAETETSIENNIKFKIHVYISNPIKEIFGLKSAVCLPVHGGSKNYIFALFFCNAE